MEDLHTIDLVVFIGYLIGMVSFGIYITTRDKTENAQDYFLASRALPWWAVGGSLIASNISTEQVLAMNGSGFELGMAIATYELMAAITLIIVAKFLLPVFLQEGIYTMPQFLERRFDQRTRSTMSVFWIALFVFVNISSVLYLGGLAIQSLLGIDLLWGIVGLVLYSASFSIFGGLKAVVWTDVIQVVVLVLGGFLAAYFVLLAVDGSFLGGLEKLYELTPERFEMIFERGDTYTATQADDSGSFLRSSYDLLPGISVLMGGMWITNLYYWGTNQYIIQRALAAKTLDEAQKGVVFASVLKLLMPIMVVVPGIAAYVLHADIAKADEAFVWVLGNHVPVGIKGLVFAGLVAAIGSSISSIVNSASTIFTIDIYKDLINKEASELQLVRVGRISAAVALVLGALIAPSLQSLEQAFQYIQEYTGYVSPGVFAVFMFGMFWRRTTADAAFWTILLAIPFSVAIAFVMPGLPFLDRMAVSFLGCCVSLVAISGLESSNISSESTRTPFRVILIALIAMVAVSTGLKMGFTGPLSPERVLGFITLIGSLVLIYILFTERGESDSRAIDIDTKLFATTNSFNIAAIGVMLFLAAFYSLLN